jgi:glycosyltransferase involved in cell wall biosynthesis
MGKKVVIDTIPLLSPSTGIGRYVYELCTKLTQHSQYELTYFYGYYSTQLLEPEAESRSKLIKSILSRSAMIKKTVRWFSFQAAKFSRQKFDLYYQPNFIANKSIRADKVITAIHDFSFMLYKEFHPKERVEHFDKYFEKSVKNSDHLICFSEFTKNEICNYLDVPEERVSVIYHGIQEEIFYQKTNVVTTLNLPSKFILSVGSIEPRKNLIGLLQAYDLLSEDLKREYKLVLLGFKGWNNKDIMKLINKNSDSIVYLGYVSNEELANAYNLASLFVFPSFYEGFGFPPLESMACGTPVVASNVSSIPEVCSDAAEYFEPDNIENIGNVIETVLSNKELYATMVEKGLSRAKEFTWDRSIQQHLHTFDRVMNESN